MPELWIAGEGGLGVWRGGALEPVLGEAIVSFDLDAEGRWWATSEHALWRQGAQVAKSEHTLTCVLARGEQALVGTRGAHLLRFSQRLEPVPAFEQVAGRERWYTPWGAPADARSFAADGARVYLNVHVGGIVLSTDGGQSWRPTAFDLDDDAHQLCAEAGELFAATARGLAFSPDAGSSWRFFTEGLHARYLRAVALSGRFVFVSASEGPSGRRSAIYRRPRSGGRWQKCAGGLPGWLEGNIDSGCLDAAGEEVVLGERSGRLFRSGDGGDTFELLGVRAPGLSALRLGGSSAAPSR